MGLHHVVKHLSLNTLARRCNSDADDLMSRPGARGTPSTEALSAVLRYRGRYPFKLSFSLTFKLSCKLSATFQRAITPSEVFLGDISGVLKDVAMLQL